MCDQNQRRATISKLIELEDTHGIAGNAAFYLSIPPSAFPLVLKQLARTGPIVGRRAAPGLERPDGLDGH